MSDNFARSKDFIACVESLQRGETATFDSVWGSSCALLASALSGQFKNLLVVVADGKTQDDLLDDLPTFFEGMLERFPACMPVSSSGVHLDLEYGDRLRLIKGLLAGDKLQSLSRPSRHYCSPRLLKNRSLEIPNAFPLVIRSISQLSRPGSSNKNFTKHRPLNYRESFPSGAESWTSTHPTGSTLSG
mgnify:CR=1 FL=1